MSDPPDERPLSGLIRSATSYKKLSYADQIKILRHACVWLTISEGRAHQYERLLMEFWERGARSREHILSISESWEIIEIYEMWKDRICGFPGLDAKIRATFREGPVLREDEKPRNSGNRPRNDAFVYLTAGNLLEADIPVVAVEGIIREGKNCHANGDISFTWNGNFIDIQGKRPQNLDALEKHIRKARKQIKKSSGAAYGLIAIDCSVFLRPPGALIERPSAEQALEFYRQRMEKMVVPLLPGECEPKILGFYLFFRGPAMTPLRKSMILSYTGKPITEYRPECVSSEFVVPNPTCSDTSVLPEIYSRLRKVIECST